MKYVAAEKKWAGDPADEAEFQEWFLGQTEADNLDPVVEGLLALQLDHGWLAARAVLELERRHPFRIDQTPAQQQALPLSRLLARLVDCYTPTLARIFDRVVVYLLENNFSQRALDLLGTLIRRYEANGDLLFLGRAWMRRGRLYTDLHRRDEDMPCYWRALSALHASYTRPGLTEAERREIALSLSSVQHQFAVRCEADNDLAHAMIYNHRSLAIRTPLKDAHLSSASYHNIARDYVSDNNPGRALLNFLRTIHLDITSSYASARRITYENVAHLVRELQEPATALALYDKGLSYGFRSAGLIQGRGLCLLALERREEGIAHLRELVRDLTEGLPGTRLKAHWLIIGALEQLDKADEAAAEREALLDCILENTMLLPLDEDQLKQCARARLEKADPADHRQRAVLCVSVGDLKGAVAAIDRAVAQDAKGNDPVVAKLREFRASLSGEAAPPAAAGDERQVNKAACRACERPGTASPGPGGAAGLCSDCQQALDLQDLVAIPAGRAERPDGKSVQVPAFHIDRFPVTNKLFRIYHRVMRLKDVKENEDWPKNWKHSLFRHPDQPMTCVSVADCEAFCAWRSRLTGRKFRLPTAEEWFRAALGDDGRIYPWGNEPPDHGRAAYSVIEDEYAVPAPVGLFPRGASPFGVQDLAGNVWEWTSSTQENGTPMYLGGSCGSEAGDLDPRSTIHLALQEPRPDCRDSLHVGFRCVAETAPVARKK